MPVLRIKANAEFFKDLVQVQVALGTRGLFETLSAMVAQQLASANFDAAGLAGDGKPPGTGDDAGTTATAEATEVKARRLIQEQQKRLQEMAPKLPPKFQGRAR